MRRKHAPESHAQAIRAQIAKIRDAMSTCADNRMLLQVNVQGALTRLELIARQIEGKPLLPPDDESADRVPA